MDKSGLIVASPASLLISVLSLPAPPFGLLRLFLSILRLLLLHCRGSLLSLLLHCRGSLLPLLLHCRGSLRPLLLHCRGSLLMRGLDRG